MTTTQTAADAPKFIVEVYKRGSYMKRRVFKTAQAAVNFSNDFYDRFGDTDRWSLQVITPTTGIWQMSTNGNATAKGMA